MGVARSIEQRLEGLVEGFFTKVFRSGLQPVEVGRRILREMAEGKTVSVNRVYAPNEFRVFLGPHDHERFDQMRAGLEREFSELVIEQAKQNRWNLMGLPRISFTEVDVDSDPRLDELFAGLPRDEIFLACKTKKRDAEGAREELERSLTRLKTEMTKAGVLVSDHALEPSSKSKRLIFTNHKLELVDGPFAEAKELIAGFWLWEVKSMDEAVEWVKRCPNPMNEDSTIEIRPVFEAEDFGDELTPELREREGRMREQLEANG